MGAAAATVWLLASGPAIWQWRVTAAARSSALAASAFASPDVKRRLPVLREKDILQPEDANTPAKRVYFPVMMMYLDETAAGKVYDEFALRLSEFMGASRNPEILAACVAASRHVMAREYYKALMAARKLVEYEEGLANVAAGVQDRSLEG
jgi:flagellar protein FlbT